MPQNNTSTKPQKSRLVIYTPSRMLSDIRAIAAEQGQTVSSLTNALFAQLIEREFYKKSQFRQLPHQNEPKKAVGRPGPVEPTAEELRFKKLEFEAKRLIFYFKETILNNDQATYRRLGFAQKEAQILDALEHQDCDLLESLIDPFEWRKALETL